MVARSRVIASSLAPERDTVKTTASPSLATASETKTVGAASFSTIVPVPVSVVSPTVPAMTLSMPTLKVSSPS